MLKETSYQEKIQMLTPWLKEIIEVVKRDLKNEHLKIDRAFCKRYFLGKNPQQVTVEEMASAYEQDIANGNVGLGEFIASRWLLKHTDIYGLFEERLRSIVTDFEALEMLPEEIARPLAEEAIMQYGAKKTYLFSVFNSVVFPQSIYEKLRHLAEEESAKSSEEQETKKIEFTLEALQKKHEREITSLTDRYEKKINGLQRKYLQDTDKLKQQIALLQKKLISC